MKVLYIAGVGPFGGGSRSLFEAIRAMPAGTVEAHFVAVRGTALAFYRSVACDVIATRGLARFDNTLYSHYRGVRWLVLLRELAHVPFTVLALLRARRRWGSVDLIHANEVTEIFSLWLARRLFRAPTVMHVRAVVWNDARSRRCRWLAAMLRRHVDAVVPIDETVLASLPPGLPTQVIHNSFTPERAAVPDRVLADRLAKLRPGSLKVGFVGNLHHSKGILDLLEAAAHVVAEGHDVDFLVLGGATRENRGLRGWLLRRFGLAQDVQALLDGEIAQRGLQQRFHLLGHSNDIQQLYERIDVLCFPSHFDAPGRPIFEAAFSGVPAIAAICAPKADTLVHGETGLAVASRDPAGLAAAIARFATNREEAPRMGQNARALARANFDPRLNAERLLALYERVAGSRAR